MHAGGPVGEKHRARGSPVRWRASSRAVRVCQVISPIAPPFAAHDRASVGSVQLGDIQ